jgi:hypothetical protein
MLIKTQILNLERRLKLKRGNTNHTDTTVE